MSIQFAVAHRISEINKGSRNKIPEICEQQQSFVTSPTHSERNSYNTIAQNKV